MTNLRMYQQGVFFQQKQTVCRQPELLFHEILKCWQFSFFQVSGVYFVDCHESKVAKQGEDMEAAARLWTQSDKIVSQ